MTQSSTNYNDLLVSMVRDLERTRYKYHGYSYVRTMRNIVIGKEEATIAPHFQNKPYYRIYPYLSLQTMEWIMDKLVNDHRLEIVWTDHGKLYCTPEHHEYLCSR